MRRQKLVLLRVFSSLLNRPVGGGEQHSGKICLDKKLKALACGYIAPTDRRRIMDLHFDAGIAARMDSESVVENKEIL